MDYHQFTKKCDGMCDSCECPPASGDKDDDQTCPRCHGDGMDPWNDYLLPCPECSGSDL